MHASQYFGRSLLFLSVHLVRTAAQTTESEYDLNDDDHCLPISIFVCDCLRLIHLIWHFASGSARFIVFGAKTTIEVISFV